jgi:hypothetical protein
MFTTWSSIADATSRKVVPDRDISFEISRPANWRIDPHERNVNPLFIIQPPPRADVYIFGGKL